MFNKLDLRVVKTQKALKSSLMDLLIKHNFEDIKVKNITEKALVNRATFYYHFKDKYDLLYSILDDELNSLLSLKEEIFTTEDLKTKPMIGILYMLKYFEQNALFYKNAFKTEGYESLSIYFKKRIKDLMSLWVDYLSVGKEPLVDIDIFTTAMSTAYTTIVIEWLKNDMNESAEYLFNQIKIMIENNFYECLGV